MRAARPRPLKPTEGSLFSSPSSLCGAGEEQTPRGLPCGNVPGEVRSAPVRTARAPLGKGPGQRDDRRAGSPKEGDQGARPNNKSVVPGGPRPPTANGWSLPSPDGNFPHEGACALMRVWRGSGAARRGPRVLPRGAGHRNGPAPPPRPADPSRTRIVSEGQGARLYTLRAILAAGTKRPGDPRRGDTRAAGPRWHIPTRLNGG